MISKGELLQALDFIEKNKQKTQDEEQNYILSVKEIQILYYQNNIVQLNEKIKGIISNNKYTHIYQNDIFKIMNDILLFGEDANFEKYCLAMLKIYQNKRTEAISLLESISNIENEEISNKIKYDCAYLMFLQGEISQSLNMNNNINIDSPFKEQAVLLEAEINDYILNNKSKAVDLYLYFLDSYNSSIYYEDIRLRLMDSIG